jgi:hypothetical protein
MLVARPGASLKRRWLALRTADIFRRHDIGGWAKGGWLILVLVLPYIGVFAYVTARGGSMHGRLAQRSPG